MKKLITLFLVFLFLNQKVAAQLYIPIGTTGYTHDAISENTTAIATTSGPLDGVNVMYSVAHAALLGSPYGLPNNGLISSPTKTFQLQNYTGPNLLFIQPQGQDSLTFITPVACQSLSILDFATDAFSPTTMSVTIRFTDNTTQVFSPVTVYDWLSNASTPFASGFDRMNRSAGTYQNEGGLGYVRFFTNDFAILCANQSKLIKRIIFKNTGPFNEKLGILAVAGVQVPLTAVATPSNICNTGASATITAAGSTTYTWLPLPNFAGSNATVVSVTPSVTTEYTVQAVSAQNCTYNAMVTVNVFSVSPTLTVTNTANAGGICPTKTVILTASGATSYTWTGGTTPVTNGIAFGPTTAADYTVMAENACGSASAVTSVSVHPFPTISTVASSSSLCSGTSLTLTAVGNATNYVWSGGPGGITNGVGFYPSLTATYTVIATSALSCTDLATVPVTVVTTPTLVPIATPSIFCLGNSSTLTANGATSYTWASATQTIFTNPLIITPSVAGPETFTVTKANSNCYDTKVITVVTNTLPGVFAIATPTLICSMSQSTLAAAGGNSYTWTTPSGGTFPGASPIVSPSVTSVYTVAAHDGTCVNTTTVMVATNPIPTISISGSTNMVCKGSPVTMTATGGLTHTWTSSPSTTTLVANSISQSPTVTTAFTAVGNNAVGCTASAQYFVQVNNLPNVGGTVIKTLVCSGGLSTLSATGANSYTWDPINVFTPSTVVSTTATVSGPVIYTVTGLNTTTGCQNTKTLQVNVFVPVLTISGATNTCAGGPVSLQGGGGNVGSYSWNTGSGTPVNLQTITTTLTAASIFTLSATTTSGSVNCPGTKTVQLGIYFNPSITATPQKTFVCKGETFELYGGGGVSYDWSNGMQGSTVTVGPITNIQTLNYTVTGTDANGCANTATAQVKVSSCSGINELSGANSSVLIYPNPNNGIFTIQADKDMILTLSNELGQVIRIIGLSGINARQVSVTDLAKGIYFISGQGINQKIVVAK